MTSQDLSVVERDELPNEALESTKSQDDKAANGSDDNRSFHMNHPHPSLECPPLYFALEKAPRRLEKIKGFYAWRWRVSYPLQKRIPLSNYLRVLKIYLTYGEVLILIPLLVLAVVCIAQSFVHPDVVATGKTSRFAVGAALLFGQKNSYMTMVLGVPFERALFFHKFSGYVAVITGFLHGWAYVVANHEHGSTFAPVLKDFFVGSMNTSGTCILIFGLVIYLTSLSFVRKRLFEVFYYVHLVCLVGIVGGTAFHTGPMVPLIVFFTTGVDFLVRKVYMARYRYPQDASLNIISESVVEVVFPKVKGFDYNPGQYVYLAISELSSFEWHPFSICSSPHQPHVSLYIRTAGNWTASLHKLALKQTKIGIQLDGPYGNFGVDLTDKTRYKVVMLVGGGIGVSPLQSLCTHLLMEHEGGSRHLKKIKFIWVERDPLLTSQSEIFDMATSAAPVVQERERVHSVETLASKLFANVPPGTETDDELEALYQSFDLEVLDAKSTSCDEVDNFSTSSLYIDDDHDSARAKSACSAQDLESPAKEKNSKSLSFSSGWPTTKEARGSPFADKMSTWEHLDRFGNGDVKSDTCSSLSKEKCVPSKGGAVVDGATWCNIVDPTSIDATSQAEKEEFGFSLKLNKDRGDEDTFQLSSEQVLDSEIYLTCPQIAKSLSPVESSMRGGCVKVGRPDLAALFNTLRQQAIDLGEKRVAVCVCGPRRIVHLCRQACIQLSDETVRFDYHVETYG